MPGRIHPVSSRPAADGRRRDLQHEIRGAEKRRRIGFHHDAELAIRGVREACSLAGARLDRDLVAGLNQLLARLRHEGHAPLAGGGLSGHCDAHFFFFWVVSALRRTCSGLAKAGHYVRICERGVLGVLGVDRRGFSASVLDDDGR